MAVQKLKDKFKRLVTMITKQLEGKGNTWPLYTAVSAYAMNTFASKALQDLSPFELVFAKPPRDLTGMKIEPLDKIPLKYHTYMALLYARAKYVRDLAP